MTTLHGKKIKKGDKVWTTNDGYITVDKIKKGATYAIVINGSNYTSDGKYNSYNKYPSLFWKEQTFDLSKPLPKLKVDDKVIVWDDESNKLKRYFSHFTKSGEIMTFVNGRTSFSASDTSATAWKSWEVYKEDDK